MSPLDRPAVRATWSWPGVVTLLVILLFPLYGPLFPSFDGWLFPVTTKLALVDVRPVDGGVTVRLKFKKIRDCEYLGASMDRDGAPIDFAPVQGGAPVTLATGEQLSRPWFVGASSLDHLHLRFVHRCSPLWLTVTDVYP